MHRATEPMAFAMALKQESLSISPIKMHIQIFTFFVAGVRFGSSVCLLVFADCCFNGNYQSERIHITCTRVPISVAWARNAARLVRNRKFAFNQNYYISRHFPQSAAMRMCTRSDGRYVDQWLSWIFFHIFCLCKHCGIYLITFTRYIFVSNTLGRAKQSKAKHMCSFVVRYSERRYSVSAIHRQGLWRPMHSILLAKKAEKLHKLNMACEGRRCVNYLVKSEIHEFSSRFSR